MKIDFSDYYILTLGHIEVFFCFHFALKTLHLLPTSVEARSFLFCTCKMVSLLLSHFYFECIGVSLMAEILIILCT